MIERILSFMLSLKSRAVESKKTTIGGGVAGGVMGSAPSPQPSNAQAKAQALLSQVQQEIKTRDPPKLPGLPAKRLLPLEKDQLVKEAAVRAGLPYTTYFDLETATRIPTARQVTPRENAPQGTAPTGTTSVAERVRERALKNRQQAAPPPPARPSNRSQGPGPVWR